MDVQKRKIGEQILTKRRELGWTQEDLAIKTGLTARTIGSIERGVDFGTMSNMVSIFKALGLNEIKI